MRHILGRFCSFTQGRIRERFREISTVCSLYYVCDLLYDVIGSVQHIQAATPISLGSPTS